MKVLLIIAIGIVIFGMANYDKLSYKKSYDRNMIISQHPDWYPNCGINFLQKDPQWFIDNGYESYVEKKEIIGENMNNRRLLCLRSILADEIKRIYLMNFNSKSLTINDYERLTKIYTHFKDCSIYKESWVDKLAEEMHTWKIVGKT